MITYRSVSRIFFFIRGRQYYQEGQKYVNQGQNRAQGERKNVFSPFLTLGHITLVLTLPPMRTFLIKGRNISFLIFSVAYALNVLGQDTPVMTYSIHYIWGSLHSKQSITKKAGYPLSLLKPNSRENFFAIAYQAFQNVCLFMY